MRARTATFISAVALSWAMLGTGTAMADTSCADADAMPGTVADAVVQAATVCLLNEQRAAVGEAPLVLQAQLQTAANAYAQRMAAEHFFAHVSPDGSTLESRVAATKYQSRYSRWALGENVGWGTGTLATPAGMVVAWMNSDEHRANILDPTFREIGIGIAAGVPVSTSSTSPGATFATEFGVRTGLRRPSRRTLRSGLHGSSSWNLARRQ